MFFYKIPSPNEAMVVSGSRHGTDGGQFRIVTGKGAFVLPWKNKARWLSLDLREALISETCVTKLRIPLTVEAVAVFKVGDDNSSIWRRRPSVPRPAAGNGASHRAGARRPPPFDSRWSHRRGDNWRPKPGGTRGQGRFDRRDGEARAGHRCIPDTRDQGLNWIYREPCGAPHAAAAGRDARIAAAQADQAATEKEQEANASRPVSCEAEIKQAGYRAEIEQAQAAASQAGPLAQAKASPASD